jgi:hypothetical protein
VALAVLLTLAQGAAGQALPEGQPFLGITGGTTISTLSGDYIESTESRNGILVGAAFAYPLSRHLTFRTEANWQIIRSNADVQTGQNIRLDLGQLSFPVMLSGVLPFADRYFLSAEAGLTASFNAQCDLGVSGGGPTSDCDDSVLGTTLGLVQASVPLGLGFGFSMGPGDGVLSFEGRYSYGLNSIFTEPDRSVRPMTWTVIARAVIPIFPGDDR